MAITRYRTVYVGKDHPFSSMGRVVGLHRFIMAEHLGRPLESDEVVHHRDTNPLNNSLDNLLLTDHVHHEIEHLRLRAMGYRRLANRFDDEANLLESGVKIMDS